jgi:hypothetical protein
MIQNLYSFAKKKNPNPKHEMEYTLNQVSQWNLHKKIENLHQQTCVLEIQITTRDLRTQNLRLIPHMKYFKFSLH